MGSKKLNVAVVGATGLVGQECLKIFAERRFPVASLRLMASDRSAGRRIQALGAERVVEEAEGASFRGVDIVFSAIGGDLARKLAPRAVAEGAVVIDKSSAFRADPQVPLVVPEVNAGDLKGHKGIIASPNCSTIQMVVAIYPLHKVNPIKRIVAATYQSVSGWGAAAMDELREQSRASLQGQAIPPAKAMPHQIAFNVLPHIDSFSEDGYTGEEVKMATETWKIMHAPDIAVSATCVRVPVYISHSEAVWAEFTSIMEPAEAARILSCAPGVKVVDDPRQALYPLAIDAAGRDEVFVGRIRRDTSFPNGLVMWIVSDNLRKGAATNAVQIAEELIKRGWLY